MVTVGSAETVHWFQVVTIRTLPESSTILTSRDPVDGTVRKEMTPVLEIYLTGFELPVQNKQTHPMMSEKSLSIPGRSRGTVYHQERKR